LEARQQCLYTSSFLVATDNTLASAHDIPKQGIGKTMVTQEMAILGIFTLTMKV
jgi:hypothetical protein